METATKQGTPTTCPTRTLLELSGIKMVNQLLAGVHIASAAEAMAFGARLGLNTRLLFDFITISGVTSWLVLAGDTEFAKNAVFGYKSSNLRDWIEEKTGGRIPASIVASVSIELLRKGGPDAVCQHLCSLKKGSTCVVNTTSERDMAVFALGMIKVELMGKHFLCRTGASFVSSYGPTRSRT
ncbi:hypothetical protein Ahy_A09g046155 isoform D [Arachis hypogaea]|uniref:Four-carbon acid sugar kinase N-terminal domain-containing protein n=1 Tax=Arachis hypogaea TaxID=3818 RepID=A0A445BP22_ARAHY|nr:hypothetical protein Ahy_A09g046155 isoform D [Arachis hypogaea]